MTELEMQEKLKAKCKEAWETYKSYEALLGEKSLYTQKKLTEWATYLELYKEFFNDVLI